MDVADDQSSRVRPVDLVLAITLGLLALAVYTRTVAPSLLEEGDGVELATVSYVLGISHPTGYPLFTLLGFAFTHLLPWGSVVGRLNLMSTLLAAATIPVVYAMGRQLRLQPFGAALTALVFGTSFSFWTVSTRGDVHVLHALLVSLALALLIRWGRLRAAGLADAGAWRTALPTLTACAFVCGLSITNHITTYLLAPGFLTYLLWTDTSIWRKPRRLLQPVLALLGPLLLYLYIPIRGSQLMADPTLAQDPAGIGIPLRITWGFVSPHYRSGGPDGFINLVLGLDYGPGMLSIPWSEAPGRLATIPGLLAQQVGSVGLALGLIGFVVLSRQTRREAVLLGIVLLTFAAQVTRATEQNMAVFLIPAYLILAACLGQAADWLLAGVARLSHGSAQPTTQALLGAALLLLPVSQVAANYPLVDRSDDWSVYLYTQDLLDLNPPQGAVLLGAGDFITPIRYRQTVEGLRQDLVPVHIGFGTERFLDLVERCRQNGRPVYMLETLPNEERGPGAGRFAAKISPLPVFGEVRPQYAAYTNIADQVALLGYDMPAESVRTTGVFKVRFYWQVLRKMQTNYQFFVRLITPDSHIANQIERAPVSAWFPTSQWWQGAIFSDDVRIPIPAHITPGIYNLEVAWKQGDALLPLVRQGYEEPGPIVLRQITIAP